MNQQQNTEDTNTDQDVYGEGVALQSTHHSTGCRATNYIFLRNYVIFFTSESIVWSFKDTHI